MPNGQWSRCLKDAYSIERAVLATIGCASAETSALAVAVVALWPDLPWPASTGIGGVIKDDNMMVRRA